MRQGPGRIGRGGERPVAFAGQRRLCLRAGERRAGILRPPARQGFGRFGGGRRAGGALCARRAGGGIHRAVRFVPAARRALPGGGGRPGADLPFRAPARAARHSPHAAEQRAPGRAAGRAARGKRAFPHGGGAALPGTLLFLRRRRAAPLPCERGTDPVDGAVLAVRNAPEQVRAFCSHRGGAEHLPCRAHSGGVWVPLALPSMETALLTFSSSPLQEGPT